MDKYRVLAQAVRLVEEGKTVVVDVRVEPGYSEPGTAGATAGAH